jgi:putative molybdopterin biosynthesis protein
MRCIYKYVRRIVPILLRMTKKNTPRVALSVRAELHMGASAMDLSEMRLLLRAVADSRTILAAAEATATTYRTLWGRLEHYARALGHPVVAKSPGQGTQLTPTGRAILATLEQHAGQLRIADGQLAETLASGIQAALGGAAAPLRVHASHDFAIARALSQHKPSELDVRYVGGAKAAKALLAGEADVAGFHTPSGAGAVLENVFQTLRESPDFWMLPLMEREQGIMIARGNPRGVFALTDLAKPGVRFINRQRGSGTRILLDQLLHLCGVSGEEIAGYELEEFTHQAVAAMVGAGAADAGLGLRAAAVQFKLDFIPLGREIYYLAGSREFETLGSVRDFVEKIKANAAALEGYVAL